MFFNPNLGFIPRCPKQEEDNKRPPRVSSSCLRRIWKSPEHQLEMSCGRLLASPPDLLADWTTLVLPLPTRRNPCTGFSAKEETQEASFILLPLRRPCPCAEFGFGTNSESATVKMRTFHLHRHNCLRKKILTICCFREYNTKLWLSMRPFFQRSCKEHSVSGWEGGIGGSCWWDAGVYTRPLN